MRAMLERILTQIREFLGRMTRRNRVLLVVLVLVVIILAIVAASLLGRTNYVLLHNAQDMAEAGRIYSALQEMGVQPRIDGTRVLVPENRVGELGVRLSAEGVIGPTGTDLEILNMASSFNVTESHAKKLYEAQRASEIRTYIMQSPRIQNCTVIVSMGETSAFARPQNTNKPYASVMLKVSGGATLTNQEAQTIAEIVRTSVPGIDYENITISDDNLHQYKVKNDGSVDPDSEINARVTLKNVLSKQLQEQAEQILTPIFGMSNVEITVMVALNFDKVSSESVEYAPPIAGSDEGLVISSSDLWEAQRRKDNAEGIPGTDSNAMGAVEYPYGTLDENELYEKRVWERNFALNEVRTLIEREQGTIEAINIAVMVNSLAVEEDYTDEITDIISRGMGIPAINVAVKSLPFLNRDTSLEDMYASWQAYEDQQKQRELLMTIIMWAVILALGIAFIMLIRTIVKSVKPQEPEPVFAEGGPGMIDYTIGEEYGEGMPPDIPDVELNKKSAGLEQIERFIDKDAGAVAQLLRNWLTDE